MIKRRVKYNLLRLFRLRSGAHKIALGIAIGFLPNWIPTFGLGPILSVALAKLFRGNLVSAFIGGIIGSPVWPLLFLLNYKMGNLIFLKNPDIPDLQQVAYAETATNLASKTSSISLNFVTGMFVNIILFTFLFYLVFYLIFKRYRLLILARIRTW